MLFLQSICRLIKVGISISGTSLALLDDDVVRLVSALTGDIAGWVTRMESNWRNECSKPGLVKAVTQGKRLGWPPGSKDKKKRGCRGYLLRYAK